MLIVKINQNYKKVYEGYYFRFIEIYVYKYEYIL